MASQQLQFTMNHLLQIAAYNEVHGDSQDIADSRLQVIEVGGSDRLQALPQVMHVLFAHLSSNGTVDTDLVDRAVYQCEALVRTCDRNHSDRVDALALGGLAALLTYRARSSNGDLDRSCLDDSIKYFDTVLSESDESISGSFRITLMQMLAQLRMERFVLTRHMNDLDQGCNHFLELCHLFQDGASRDPLRLAATLSDLGKLFSIRFDMKGQKQDLLAAIEYHRRALDLRQELLLDISAPLHDLANALITRFLHLGSNEDLQDAYTYHQHSLDLRQNGHIARPISLISLGHLLTIRAQCKNNANAGFDINEAISYLRQALPLCTDERVWCLNRLVLAFRTRFVLLESHEEHELQETFRYAREAADRLVPDDPSLVEIHKNLGYLLYIHGEYDAAFMKYRAAATHSTGSVRERLSAAAEWAAYARQCGHRSTGDAYNEAMTILNRCLIAHATVDSQYEFLARPFTRSDVGSLSSDAASFAIEHRQFNKAVEMLEQGRTFVWCTLRGYREPLDELYRADPARAAKFEQLSVEVESFAINLDLTGSFSLTSFGDPNHSRRLHNTGSGVADAWRVMLRDIRENVLGFRRFLLPKPFTELMQAASAGPVIMLNRSQYRSDAMIIRHGMPVACVPLHHGVDWLIRDHLSTGPQSFLIRSAAKIMTSNRPEKTEKHTLAILRNVWKLIVRDIVTVLQGPQGSEPLPSLQRQVEDLPRIWWCPTGIFGTLPLHAAGPYSDEPNLSDLYLSSYTPSLSALISARRNLEQVPVELKLLFTGVPGSADNRYQVLPEVLHEYSTVRRLVPLYKTLIGPEATPSALLAEIGYPSVSIHLACHGLHNNQWPFESAFLLHNNEPLTLRDIMATRLQNPQLAFLAACNSAAATAYDDALPDEVLHLAAALQFSGFQSVVGSLWYMMDHDAPVLANEFYGYLMRNGVHEVDLTESAVALHKATKQLIRRGVPPQRWASFIHIGI